MRRWATLAVLLAMLGTASAAFAQEGPGARPRAGERVLAIVGGEVHTGTGTVFRRGVVLCRGGKIIAVGSDLDVPEGARVIDAAGRWVVPGLVAPSGANFGIRRGKPGVGERFADNLDPETKTNELALAAGITAYHAEGPKRGIYGYTNAVVKPALGRPDLMVVKEPAALTVSLRRTTVSDRAAFESLLAGTKRWIDKGRSGRSPGNAAVIAALDRSIPVRISARNEAGVRQALALARKFDLKLVITDCHEGWLLPEEIAAASAVAVVHPRQRVWPRTGEEDRSGSSIEACAILEKAGARFCVLPPGGFGGGGHGIGLGGIAGRDMLTYPFDAAFAVRGGASEEAAFRAITLTAAEALGVEDRVGSLTVGKDADVVIFQGDPLDYRFVPETTIVSGEVLYERSKSKLFAHLPDRR